jgi:hypothetical protein
MSMLQPVSDLLQLQIRVKRVDPSNHNNRNIFGKQYTEFGYLVPHLCNNLKILDKY